MPNKRKRAADKPVRLWYRLTDARHRPIDAGKPTISSLSCDADALIDDFRTAVKLNNGEDLAQCAARRLEVYDRDEEDATWKLLSPAHQVSALRDRSSEAAPLDVVIPPAKNSTISINQKYEKMSCAH